MSPEISIIIPVYNAEKYLEDCLQSISNQSFNDFEILAINDGSTDSSLEILEKYKKKEPRLKVFSQVNKGVSVARNLGLEIAQGKYIGFVDADDWLHPKTLETYIITLRENDLEIIISQFLSEKESSIIQGSKEEILGRNAIEQKIFPKFIDSDVYNSVCNKLYKKQCIEKVNARFPIGTRLAEDAQFNYQVFAVAQKVSEINFRSYFYRNVEGSATKNVIKNDYLQSNISIYNINYQKYFGTSVSESEILKLKNQRFFRSIIALIYIYFNPKNQFTLVQRFLKIKEIVNNDLVIRVFLDNSLKQNLGRYDRATFSAIRSKNILKLYLYTLYSYYRNL